MNSCKTPCQECPFKKDSPPGWLADWTTQKLHNYVMAELPFPCHMSHEKEVTIQEAINYPLCAGAIAYMKKNGKLPVEEEMKNFVKNSTTDLDNILNIREFFEHHKI